MQEKQYNIPPQYELEDGIDVMEYISKLWKHRSMIIKWCCVGAIVGLVVGFSLPKTYKAGALLAPEIEQRMSTGVSSIASMMGMNVNNSLDAISYEMYPDVVHSTPFIVGLFDIPVQFERKDSLITTTLLDYMLEYQKSPWWTPIVQAPFKVLGWCVSLLKSEEEENVQGDGVRNPINLSKKERGVVGYFAENIQVGIDKKNGKTQIGLKMQDPLVVYTVMQTILDNLKIYMTEYRTSKASQDAANLAIIHDQRKADYHKAMQAYAQYADANKNVVLLSAQVEREHLEQEMKLAYQVYSQVATQLEGARIKELQDKPVFAVIEPPVIPNRKAGPSKAKLLIVFTFLAGCCAGAWALYGDDLLCKIKQVTESK